MGKMNILIIDSLAVGDTKRIFSRDFIGGGPKLIAGVLNRLGIKDLDIKIVRAEDIITKDFNLLKDYSLYLISAMSMDFNSVRTLIDQLRSSYSNKIIVIGGPIASDPNILVKLNADFSIEGESEKKITEGIKILIDNN